MNWFKKMYRKFTIVKHIDKMLLEENKKRAEKIGKLLDGELSEDEAYTNGRVITMIEILNYLGEGINK